jgi:pimeloyl-ACP methyl ester carboxylesterase
MQLVFIHGSGGSELVWKYQTEHFADAVAVTLPGRPEGEPLKTVPEASQWLKAQADAHGWKDLVLIGHSYGGGIALQYALDYPDDVAAIITVGSGGRLRVHPDTLQLMKDMIDSPEDYPASLDESYQKVDPAFAQALRERAIRQGPAAAYYDLMACDQFDVMDRLAEINKPLHAIVGTEDVMTPPKYSEFMCKIMQQADMTVIEGGTHFVFAEQPDAVNQAIENFLTRELKGENT